MRLTRAHQPAQQARDYSFGGGTEPPGPDRALAQPVTVLRGVGERRAQALARLGITTVEDLLLHAPLRYEDRRLRLPIAALPLGASVTAVGRIGNASFSGRWGRRRFSARVEDESGWLEAVWLNGAWRGVAAKLAPGARVALYGKLEAHPRRPGGRLLFHPDVELLKEGDEELPQPAILPVYPCGAGLSQRLLRGLVRQALARCAALLPEVLPEGVRAAYDLPGATEALWQLHAPALAGEEPLGEGWRPAAARRFLIEELFLLVLGICWRKRLRQGEPGISLPPSTRLAPALLDRLPFRLTPAQERARAEIEADLRQPRPMHRLLQGEVGSGKTIVAMLAMLAALEQGMQAALLAPTEVLAEQYARRLEEWLGPLEVPHALLTGGVPAPQRRRILRQLASGACLLLAGTHALLEEDVEFARLGLVVIDEQHRFGVAQRARLARKGRGAGGAARLPHLLVMTATPIPRSLALTVYGDLDISSIDALPPGRLVPETILLPASHQSKAWLRLHRAVAAGGQAYVVCPLREEPAEARSPRHSAAARQLVEHLRGVVLRDLRVGLLHGSQPSSEKLATLHAFQEGRLQVLVSTTVVEVGLDVANATFMAIVDADRFGLAQLHQLRGRVARGGRRGVCVALASEEAGVEGRQRLATFARCSDGFAIAEHDLALRGAGEVLGLRQAGLPALGFADLRRDLTLARDLRGCAEGLLARDPSLSSPQHAALREALGRRWGDGLAALGSG